MQQLIYSILFVGYMTAKQMYFNFDANINTPPFQFRIHKKTVQAILADMLIVAGIGNLFGTNGIWIVIFGIFLDLLMLADLLYMRYYKNPLSVSVILHNIKVMKEARESVLGVIKSKDFLYLVDIPIFILIMVRLQKTSIPLKIQLLYSAAFFLVGTIWLSWVYHISNRAPYKWNRKRIARDLGILFFHCSDLKKYITEKIKKQTGLTKEEKELALTSFCPLHQNKFTGLGKGKNLIMVQMEAMQDFLIDLKINEKEVTPNLNQLMKENIRLHNMFFQTSVANTSDAEVLSNNALFPLYDKPACYELQNNEFYSLGTRMREKGYRAMAFHGNQASTWNRYLVYRQYGYEKFIDNTILNNDEVIYLGLSDKSFYKQTLEMLTNECGTEHIFGFLISLSQHHPYRQFSDFDFPVGSYEGTMFGDYLKGAHYADQAIGEFINDLKSRGLYDSSILFMYGDHSGIPELYYSNQQLKEKKNRGEDLDWLKAQKVAALMHIPNADNIGLKQGTIIEKVVGQVDILPTLCNLYELNGDFLLGEDILEDTYTGSVILRDGTVITNDFIHYNLQNSVYDWKTNKKCEMTRHNKTIVDKLENRLKVSDIIMEHDGIRYLRNCKE